MDLNKFEGMRSIGKIVIKIAFKCISREMPEGFISLVKLKYVHVYLCYFIDKIIILNKTTIICQPLH